MQDFDYFFLYPRLIDGRSRVVYGRGHLLGYDAKSRRTVMHDVTKNVYHVPVADTFTDMVMASNAVRNHPSNADLIQQ